MSRAFVCFLVKQKIVIIFFVCLRCCFLFSQKKKITKKENYAFLRNIKIMEILLRKRIKNKIWIIFVLFFIKNHKKFCLNLKKKENMNSENIKWCKKVLSLKKRAKSV